MTTDIITSFIGPAFGLLVAVFITYFIDKRLRQVTNDFYKKFSVSYNIDKYIFKKEKLDVELDS